MTNVPTEPGPITRLMPGLFNGSDPLHDGRRWGPGIATAFIVDRFEKTVGGAKVLQVSVHLAFAELRRRARRTDVRDVVSAGLQRLWESPEIRVQVVVTVGSYHVPEPPAAIRIPPPPAPKLIVLAGPADAAARLAVGLLGVREGLLRHEEHEHVGERLQAGQTAVVAADPDRVPNLVRAARDAIVSHGFALSVHVFALVAAAEELPVSHLHVVHELQRRDPEPQSPQLVIVTGRRWGYRTLKGIWPHSKLLTLGPAPDVPEAYCVGMDAFAQATRAAAADGQHVVAFGVRNGDLQAMSRALGDGANDTTVHLLVEARTELPQDTGFTPATLVHYAP